MPLHDLLPGLERIHHKWGWFLALGALLILAGVLAIMHSLAATMFSMLFVGFLLIVGGAMQTIHSFQISEWGGFLLHLLGGVLAMVVGMLAVSSPGASALGLTLILAVYLMVGGIFRLMSGILLDFPAHVWVALSGLVAFLLGLALWRQWPVSGLWFIGVCVGIDLILHGASWIAFAMAARNLPSLRRESSLRT